MVDLAASFLFPGELATLKTLVGKLQTQQKLYAEMNVYYEEGGPLPILDPKIQDRLKALLNKSKANWCEPVVDVMKERLQVVGVRLGATADSETNRAVYESVWEGNRLNATEGALYTDSLVGGVAFHMVDPFKTTPTGAPRVTAESPLEMAVLLDSWGDVRAGIKVWKDDERRWRLNFYIPGGLYKFHSREKATAKLINEFPSEAQTEAGKRIGLTRWVDWGNLVPEGDEIPEGPIVTGYVGVPIVAYQNRAKLIGPGRSELKAAVPIQDRINQTILDRLVTQALDAMRQKWITGMEIVVDPDTNQPIEPFKNAFDHLLQIEDADAKIGVLEAADLGPLIQAKDSDVMELAAVTRTPPHVLISSMSILPGAESQYASEAGFVSKLEDRQRTWGEGHERVFAIVGAIDTSIKIPAETSIVWKDVTPSTLSEIADAAVKLVSVLPKEAVWERVLDASPDEIEKWRALGEAAPAAPLTVINNGAGAVDDPDADAIAKMVNAATALIRAGFDQQDALKAVGLDPIKHLGLLPVTLRAEEKIVAADV